MTTLTRTERLLLLNQYRLLALLDEDHANRVQWDRSLEVILKGYPLDHVADWSRLGDGPALTERQISAVHETLAIWQLLGDGGARFPETFVCEAFPGFGPGERPFGDYANFVLDNQDYLGVQLPAETGSVFGESPNLPRYERQIDAWDRMDKPLEPSLNQLEQLRDA